MLVNVTNSSLVFGRFRVCANEKVPAVPMTEAEEAAVKDFAKKGFLQEQPSVHKSEVVKKAEPEAKPAEAPKPEAKPAEEPKPEAKAEDKAKKAK